MSEPPYFFFSYARLDCYRRSKDKAGSIDPDTLTTTGELILAFYRALCDEIAAQTGEHSVSTGFRDRSDIEHGEDWRVEVKQALQSCPTFVPLLSPTYFKRPYCGKEWYIFEQRRIKWVAMEEAKGKESVKRPPLILPLNLMGPCRDAPACVGRVQYLVWDPPGAYESKGLLYVLRRKELDPAIKTEYLKIIDTLSKRIVEAAKEYQLPALDSQPEIDDVPNAFSAADPSSSDDEPAPQPAAYGGPEHVELLYIAKSAQGMVGVRQATDHYATGGKTWAPFWPTDKRAAAFIVREATAKMHYFFETAPRGVSIVKHVKRAAENNTIVILIIDSLSATQEGYREELAELDEKNYANVGILVTWDEEERADPKLTGELEPLFFFKSRSQIPGLLLPQLEDSASFENGVQCVVVDAYESVMARARAVRVIQRKTAYSQKPDIASAKGYGR